MVHLTEPNLALLCFALCISEKVASIIYFALRIKATGANLARQFIFVDFANKIWRETSGPSILDQGFRGPPLVQNC